MMGLEQQLVMSEPGLISIDNDLAVSKRIYQSLGLMFRDDADNLLPCLRRGDIDVGYFSGFYVLYMFKYFKHYYKLTNIISQSYYR